MRIIKFRGKRIDNGKWIYGYLLRNINGDCAIQIELNKINKGWWKSVCVIPVIPETVGQFTEFQDKNGKDVYEWDLLKSPSKEIKYFKVLFNNGSFELYHNFGRWGLLSRLYELNELIEPEVFGNIHENPGLLK